MSLLLIEREWLWSSCDVENELVPSFDPTNLISSRGLGDSTLQHIPLDYLL